MKSDAEHSTSIWMETDIPAAEPLDRDVHADVCVVGAGIAGMTTAYLLAREGARVVVLDDGLIGGGQTARTTAHLSYALDDRFSTLEKIFGEEGTRLAAESHVAAINKIEQIAEQEYITCDFQRVNGYLFAPWGQRQVLDEELRAIQRMGFNEVTHLDRAPLTFFDTGPCLRFPDVAQVHPLRYMNGLVKALHRLDGRVFTDTHAVKMQGGRNAVVEDSFGNRVLTSHIVVATNSPVNDRMRIHTKQAPYRTYVIGCRVPAGSVPPMLLWDTEEPYHYARIQSDPTHDDGRFDILIVGGEDHKTGHEEDAAERYRRLETWTRQRFSMVTDVAWRWSGQVMETFDGLAFLGRNPMDADNVYIITGDSGMGMTHGTIGAMVITDLIKERRNPWAKLYDPGRLEIRGASFGEFVKENVQVVADYADWVLKGNRAQENEPKLDTGMVARRGLSKIAIYRDREGCVHEFSAVCPHLGGLLHWNDAEKTWDCPLHGSRFEACGRVINGPANSDLKPVKEEKRSA